MRRIVSINSVIAGNSSPTTPSPATSSQARQANTSATWLPPVGQSLRVCDHPLQYRTIPTWIELALSSFQGGLPITQSYWVAYASPAQDAFGSNEFPSKTFRSEERRVGKEWRS